MIDPVTAKRIELLHPSIREMVTTGVKRCMDAGVTIRIVQGLRTWKEQDELYAQGRTKPGSIVTHAKGGESYHNYGVAFDFCLLHPTSAKQISWDMEEDADHDKIADWMEVVSIFEGMGFKWGGKWPRPKTDTPHFEMTFGFAVRELRTRYLAKKFLLENYVTLAKFPV